MSRLTSQQVAWIPQGLARYEAELKRITGATLGEIAREAAQVRCLPEPASFSIGVVAMTVGQGIIEGFTGAVAAILRHLGFGVLPTVRTDVAGLAEAAEKGADVVFLADDDRFIALNLKNGYCVDNGEATGRAYAVALALAAGGIARRNALVLGLGPVGLAAGAHLHAAGAEVLVYDTDTDTLQRVCRQFPWRGVANVPEGLRESSLVLDCTPTADFIEAEWLRPETIVAAPGIPLGLTQAAQKKVAGRLLHDPLALGVAAMAWRVVGGERGGWFN